MRRLLVALAIVAATLAPTPAAASANPCRYPYSTPPRGSICHNGEWLFPTWLLRYWLPWLP